MTFWQSKKVLVTGGGGFLGSYIVNGLHERGAKQVIVPRSKDADLRQQDVVRRVLADSCPDMVIHLAAVVGGIGANAAQPATFFYDNLIMGVTLMHEAWVSNVKKFVTVGTVCAYPKYTPIPFKEADLWNGYPEETNAPYGLAKKMLLVQGQAYHRQYGFNAIYLLPTNLYGPGDSFDPQTSHVIPALIRKFVEGQRSGAESVVVWGSGQPTRDFLYVRDGAEAILLAAERYDDMEPVNIGSGSETSIKDLAEMIAGYVGYEGQIVWDRSRPDGQPRRMLDIQRAQEGFGFQPHTFFEEGLRKTIDWYRANGL
ncbi:MAG: GDP-L-fucose synthase [Anaerolineae bacterium]|nr:GDP-L-fucose synthase [Anaerolineae bacterium]